MQSLIWACLAIVVSYKLYQGCKDEKEYKKQEERKRKLKG